MFSNLEPCYFVVILIALVIYSFSQSHHIHKILKKYGTFHESGNTAFLTN
jgi:hypothetical protein